MRQRLEANGADDVAFPEQVRRLDMINVALEPGDHLGSQFAVDPIQPYAVRAGSGGKLPERSAVPLAAKPLFPEPLRSYASRFQHSRHRLGAVKSRVGPAERPRRHAGI